MEKEGRSYQVKTDKEEERHGMVTDDRPPSSLKRWGAKRQTIVAINLQD
jgi:hypothetical protein